MRLEVGHIQIHSYTNSTSGLGEGKEEITSLIARRPAWSSYSRRDDTQKHHHVIPSSDRLRKAISKVDILPSNTASRTAHCGMHRVGFSVGKGTIPRRGQSFRNDWRPLIPHVQNGIPADAHGLQIKLSRILHMHLRRMRNVHARWLLGGALTLCTWQERTETCNKKVLPPRLTYIHHCRPPKCPKQRAMNCQALQSQS